MKTSFHTVAPGDIVVADHDVILELVLDDAAGIIVYDRARKLAAAAVISAAGPADGHPAREQAGRATRAMLSRMLKAGCRPEGLEIFALGTLLATSPQARRGPEAFGRSRVTLAYGPQHLPAPLRAEFDVGLGRIVLEPRERFPEL